VLAEAAATVSGFERRQAFVSNDGTAALVLGRGGEWALLKRHGTRVVASLLQPPVGAEAVADGVRIDRVERMLGAVTLRLSEAGRDKLLTLM